jgi:hypothetical protein
MANRLRQRENSPQLAREEEKSSCGGTRVVAWVDNGLLAVSVWLGRADVPLSTSKDDYLHELDERVPLTIVKG